MIDIMERVLSLQIYWVHDQQSSKTLELFTWMISSADKIDSANTYATLRTVKLRLGPATLKTNLKFHYINFFNFLIYLFTIWSRKLTFKGLFVSYFLCKQLQKLFVCYIFYDVLNVIVTMTVISCYLSYFKLNADL